ncbi:glycoside hydrolase family 172 protein [Rhodopirellula sp. JC639]|uniref:glycoside hydrolase family 172 protein n=1 Tax=Stieleria mannarensis TaxID=2755585 RepID=UPI00336A7263
MTIESLLREMSDRDAVARFPEVDFRLKQASSYNRASKTPDDPKGWFNNIDRNTSDKHHNFVRIEQNDGRKEWVVMEDKGPGAITRFWVPWRNQLQPGTNITIRFYFDGSSQPAIEGNMFDLFQGKGLIPFPLAHESLRSAVSFFPIPYAKGCKVTMSDHPFFFQFTYRKYAEGTKVKTFTMQDFQAADPLIDQTCKSLLNPDAETQDKASKSDGKDSLSKSAELRSGEEVALPLPQGVAAIRNLMVKLADYSDPEVTRTVVLKITADGKDTVWCPIGDFFGSGIGLNPFQGWYRTVTADGGMTSRWVMPYRENATVSIINLGDSPVDVDLSVAVDDWQWDDRSLYFHAGWRGQYPVPTRPYSDWNYITAKGRGVYVGDTLTIMNPVERWWGEGDEKIFVDGEAFPSIFGTGTEDYYAYSWGGRSTDFYEHPFHAQTFSHKYNKLNRKPKIDEKNTLGFSTETRTRALDTMPFAESLKLDMEVWSWTDCEMGYAVGCYWYGDADTTSNLTADPEGARRVPPLPDAMKNAGPDSR